MKTLVIVRHAKSSWDNPGLPDHERVLSKRGLRDAPRMGARLADWGPPVDRVISSSAVRALTTAELITQEMGLPWDEIVVDENRIRRIPAHHVNPDPGAPALIVTRVTATVVIALVVVDIIALLEGGSLPELDSIGPSVLVVELDFRTLELPIGVAEISSDDRIPPRAEESNAAGAVEAHHVVLNYERVVLGVAVEADSVVPVPLG